MRRHLQVATILALVFLGACSNTTSGLFATPIEGPENTVDVTRLPSLRVVGLVVTVPETLVATERNSYKPIGDIVWREDPFGNRHQQVQTIVESAISSGVASLNGNLPVVLHVEVTRFHALTQRTRYSVGGVHEIGFLLMVTNGRTGDIIVPPYQVDASLAGYGGYQALAAESLGLTQKVRISEYLAAVILQELTGVVPSELASVPGGAALELGEELGGGLTPFIRETN